jgi:hypothetical protein
MHIPLSELLEEIRDSAQQSPYWMNVFDRLEQELEVWATAIPAAMILHENKTREEIAGRYLAALEVRDMLRIITDKTGKEN